MITLPSRGLRVALAAFALAACSRQEEPAPAPPPPLPVPVEQPAVAAREPVPAKEGIAVPAREDVATVAPESKPTAARESKPTSESKPVREPKKTKTTGAAYVPPPAPPPAPPPSVASTPTPAPITARTPTAAAAVKPKTRVNVPHTDHVRAEIPAGLQADLDADPRMQPWVAKVIAIADECHAKSRSARGAIETVITMHENERPDADVRSLPAQLSGIVACATGSLMRTKMPLFTGREGTRYPVRLIFE